MLGNGSEEVQQAEEPIVLHRVVSPLQVGPLHDQVRHMFGQAIQVNDAILL